MTTGSTTIPERRAPRAPAPQLLLVLPISLLLTGPVWGGAQTE